MKKKGNVILILIIISVIGFIIWINSTNDVSLSVKTDHPFITTIVEKRTIPGNLYPLTEIDIKSPISGTLDKIFVKIGDKVKIGDPIAQIKLVPDPARLETAKSTVNSSKIDFDNQQQSLARNKILYDKGVIAADEFENDQRIFNQSKEQYISAQNQLTLIEKGFVRNTNISNIVRATADGSIIDLPLKDGSSIIERNTMNDGTTLATVARLDTYIFKGEVNEVDMVYLHTGMPIKININAYKNQQRIAYLYKISSKGMEQQGVMKYYIEANLASDSIVIRSGYTANAELILQKRDSVLALKEKYLQFQNDSTFVTIVTADGLEKKRFVNTGLSDGINIEILSGLKKDDRIKILNNTDITQ